MSLTDILTEIFKKSNFTFYKVYYKASVLKLVNRQDLKSCGW